MKPLALILLFTAVALSIAALVKQRTNRAAGEDLGRSIARLLLAGLGIVLLLVGFLLFGVGVNKHTRNAEHGTPTAADRVQDSFDHAEYDDIQARGPVDDGGPPTTMYDEPYQSWVTTYDSEENWAWRIQVLGAVLSLLGSGCLMASAFVSRSTARSEGPPTNTQFPPADSRPGSADCFCGNCGSATSGASFCTTCGSPT